MKRYSILLLASLAFMVMACDTFVQNVDDDIESASSGALNDEAQVPFAINGVLAQWADTHDFTTLAADLLSDQFRFGLNSDATFPTYQQLDAGLIERNNNTVDGAFNALGQYRFLADDLVERLEGDNIEFTEDAPVSRDEALFVANLHSGIARYYYATYIGLEPRQGGGVIDQSEFIPSAEMYSLAKGKFDAALSFATTDRESKLANSIAARSELYAGNFGSAVNYIQNGVLEEGDDAYSIPYAVNDVNEWWSNAGPGRWQVVAGDNQASDVGGVSSQYRDVSALRNFGEIVAANPNEANRIPLGGVTLNAGLVDFDSEEAIEYGQLKYDTRPAPITFISWQEMNLIRAELIERNELSGDALALVNAVRASFDLAALGSVDLEQIAVERDRTLFGEGARLVDQRRFSFVEWHLVGDDSWQYLPITQQELNDNDNLQ